MSTVIFWPPPQQTPSSPSSPSMKRAVPITLIDKLKLHIASFGPVSHKGVMTVALVDVVSQVGE